MIHKLQINNYKSLKELSLDVSRFNIFIGENGSGKSNLLEAIAFVAAAAADKLDNEFLVSRGIRVTDPQLMMSAFTDESEINIIKITLSFENLEPPLKYTLINDNKSYTKWIRLEGKISELAKGWKEIQDIRLKIEVLMRKHKKIDDDTHKKIHSLRKTEIPSLENKLINGTSDLFETSNNYAKSYLEQYDNIAYNEDRLKNFIIFSPENTALRNFYKEGQIEPLGINGEGLLKLLKVIQDKSSQQLQEIHETLQLFDWYSELGIPKDLSQSEDKVTITDRYLTKTFDQRSANEGFLFVLFYIALMVSEDTPKIFAIDNIDTSLNPKLCSKLIKELIRLAKKYDKQVFVTTHNPAILDGIDLGDDEQRLFVVSRNRQGHTRCKRIELKNKPRSSSNEELKLSEAFLRGYLGGLPKGF